MASILDLEESILQLENVCQQVHDQALEVFPDQDFVALDAESANILEAIADVKRCVSMAEFNYGVTALRFQLDRLEKRRKHLEDFFLATQGGELDNTMLNLNMDILKTRKEISNIKQEDVNLILEENTHKILEKYQLI